MRSYVQVLTTPTADTPGTTLLLHFDNKRYLIGSLAEGTQRASIQMGARLLKVSECFVTGRTEWTNTGGMIGMILTLADSAASSRQNALEDAVRAARSEARRSGLLDDEEKVRELEEEAKSKVRNNALTLFAPPNLNHTLATARRFVFRKGMPVNVHEILDDGLPKGESEDQWAPYWADENVKVWAMSISPTPSSGQENGSVNSRPTTPRKRSIDEVYDRQSPQSTTNSIGVATNAAYLDLTPRERDQLTVKAVVGEMFNSSWRLDTLYETPLSQVNLPASIFIRNAKTNRVERYHGPLPGGEDALPDPDLPVLVRRPWPGALVESLPPTQPAKEAISYIIRNHTQRGKFSKDAAVKLKVEMGPKWSELSAGQSVENADGETITPEMVLAPSKDGGGLAVIDLPDRSYIDPLIRRPEWREEKVMAGVGLVVWICGPGVAMDPRVQSFIREFGTLKHIVSSPDVCPNNIALDSTAASTIRLRRVDPERYRVPNHTIAASDGEKSPRKAMRERSTFSDGSVHPAARGQLIQLEPFFKFQQDQVVPPLNIAAVEKEMSEEVLDEAAKAHQAIKDDEEQTLAWAKDVPDKEAEIITLGTGSALPSKYRNVSATLLRVPGWGCVLFDCGENTLGQLKRTFAPDEFKDVLRELRLIFISHMHADHHLGTVSVIKSWYEEVHGGQPTPSPPSDDAANSVQSLLESDQERLAIISEPAMIGWLSEYAAVEDYGFSRLAPLHITTNIHGKGNKSKLNWFIPPRELAGLSKDECLAKIDANIIPASLLGLEDIQAVAVQHCHGARAVSVTFPSGFKVSYSGDCRPSRAFSQVGKGSTVCIHEATFDDELQGDAEAKNHSTTSEALGVAQAMGAKAVVLTHFSQRYQKIPVMEHGAADGEEAVPAADVEQQQQGEEDETEDVDGFPTGPILGDGDDVAVTFPDQATTNGGSGQQYDLPPSKPRKHEMNSRSTGPGPDAVKFKLAGHMRVCVAFDYMRVKVKDMPKMEKFTPAFLKLFAEEEKKVEEVKVPEVEGSGKGKKGKKEKRAKRQSVENV